MTQFLLIILLVVSLVCAVSIFIAKAQSKRAKKAEDENKALHKSFSQIKERTERLQEAFGESKKIEEKANAEKKDLAQTSDSGLADRANNLFKQL